MLQLLLIRNMKRFLYLTFICIALCGCGNKKNIPDVSNINIELTTKRFEKAFFEIDTANVSASIDQVAVKYESFIKDYLYNIMAWQPQPDTVIKYTKAFLGDSLYRTIYNDASAVFANFSAIEKEIKKALQFVKYYFPKYPLPNTIITFVGPVDGVATALTSNHEIAIGLQAYLGKNYPVYFTDYLIQIYPPYKSRRFEKEYIVVNCIQNIIDELYPNTSAGKALVEQMVEAGKRMYLLDALLPYAADSLKTGYTAKQLNDCYKMEETIWSFFLNNDLLFSNEPSITRDYIGDAPKTAALGEASPGNIGMFTGWQIVKKWMQKNPSTTLEELMKTEPRKIFDEAKYKPS